MVSLSVFFLEVFREWGGADDVMGLDQEMLGAAERLVWRLREDAPHRRWRGWGLRCEGRNRVVTHRRGLYQELGDFRRRSVRSQSLG